MQKKSLKHPANKAFFKNFHDKVVRSGKAVTENGQTTTMRIIGLEYQGKEYLLPSFNPETGKVMTDGQAIIKKYLPDIKAGRLVGYDNPKQAEQDRKIFYPEIIGNR